MLGLVHLEKGHFKELRGTYSNVLNSWLFFSIFMALRTFSFQRQKKSLKSLLDILLSNGFLRNSIKFSKDLVIKAIFVSACLQIIIPLKFLASSASTSSQKPKRAEFDEKTLSIESVSILELPDITSLKHSSLNLSAYCSTKINGKRCRVLFFKLLNFKPDV